MIDGDKLVDEYENLPHGEAREAAIKKAITIADEAGDFEWSFMFRDHLMTENEFHGDSLQSFLVFPELMKIYDDHEDELSGYQHDLMWNFKWVLNDCCDFYQISKDKAYELFDEYRRRCEMYGYSLRSYYQQLYDFEKHIDEKAEKRAYQQFVIAQRDSLCDCFACELNTCVGYELDHASIGRALETAHPILTGEVSCGNIPNNTYRNFMNYYFEHGDYENALLYCQKCYKLIANNNAYLSTIGDMLKLYAKTNLNRGFKIFVRHYNWEQASRNAVDKKDFYIGAASLFAHAAKSNKTIELSMPKSFELYSAENQYDPKVLADYYYKKAYEICEKFDKRNGNDWMTGELSEATTVQDA